MSGIIAFVRSHPVISGVVFAIFGIFLMYVSVDGANRFRLYENAREHTARVESIREASRVPPRFDLTVSWPDGAPATRSVLRTGPKAVDGLKEGDAVTILVSAIDGGVILASHRPEDRPLSFAAFEATPVIFFGIGILAFGVALAALGKRFPGLA